MEVNWKKLRLILGLIFVVGLIKMPVETAMTRVLQEEGFHPKVPESTLSEQVGVQSSIVILGGLRYMVATFLELQTIDDWSARPPKWEDLAEKYEMVTTLQPNDDESWSTFAWHLAYNAAAWYEFDDKENPPAVRQYLAKEFRERGLEMMKRGIQWNPKSYLLHRDIASLYEHKLNDPCKAAEWYRRASDLEDAPSFLYRFYAYNLAKCPGKEQQAYEVLMKLYDQGRQLLEHQISVMRNPEALRQAVPDPESLRKIQENPEAFVREMVNRVWKPTLIASIKELEVSLKIPEDQRIPEYLDRETLQIVSPIHP